MKSIRERTHGVRVKEERIIREKKSLTQNKQLSSEDGSGRGREKK